MKYVKILLILIAIFFVFYFVYLDTKKFCRVIDRNSPELTFEQAYCAGDFCYGLGEQECISVDVIDVKDKKAGKDGEPDCIWQEVRGTPPSFCTVKHL